MKLLLKKNRERLNKELPGAEKRQFLSPSTYGDFQVTSHAILKYVTGKVLDIGCGDMPYRDILPARVNEYHTFDREERAEGVNFTGDIQNMNMIGDNQYDSAICLEVLEHVPNPFLAISEINRILRTDGVLILSVPFLSRIHEEPYDFFRYTRFGLKSLLEGGGFNVISIESRGGLFTFLGHQFSTALLCLFWHIPIIKNMLFFINKWFVVKPCFLLDKFFDKNELLPAGYTCVALKK